jgi:hypothetical protein
MEYSAQFNIVIKALNLILEKIFSRNPAAWQYHSASPHATELYAEFWHGLPLEIFHHII